VVSLGHHSLLSPMPASESASMGWSWSGVVRFLADVLPCVLYSVAAVRTKVRRWRWYFATVVVAVVNSLFAGYAGRFVRLSPRWQLAFEESPFLLPLLVILPVVVGDLSGRPSYRWTHWVGIGIQLCAMAVWGASLLWWFLFMPESP